MNKEFEPSTQALMLVYEKIHSGTCHIFFDVDGTIKGSKAPSEPHGFDILLPSALQKLCDIPGVTLGICTSQSYDELADYLTLLDMQGNQSVNWKDFILEDGHVYISQNGDSYELLSPDAKKQISLLHKLLSEYLVYDSESDETGEYWGHFFGIDTPVKIPTGKYQGQCTLSLWEKGPAVTESGYSGQFEPVEGYIRQLITAFHLNKLEAIEVGNGTLRILEAGISKASALSYLAAIKQINLTQSIFVCDGTNDISAAKTIIDAGGVVIAVSNAVPEIKKLATLVSTKPKSKGVVEVFQSV